MSSKILELLTNNEKNIGSTAICLLLTQSKMYMINLGDSIGASFEKKTGKSNILTKEHNTSNSEECERIRNQGGFIIKVNRVLRVQGGLRITRSFGDKLYHPYISNQPDIESIEAKNNQYIILASDGFWNEINIEEVEKIVQESCLKDLSKKLLDVAMEKNSFIKDNCTICILDIEKMLKTLEGY